MWKSNKAVAAVGLVLLLVGASLLPYLYAYYPPLSWLGLAGIVLVIIGLVLEIKAIRSWTSGRRGSVGESLRGILQLGETGEPDLSMRQTMMRSPFFHEFTFTEVGFRLVQRLHRELAFLLQDAGISIGTSTCRVFNTNYGTLYYGYLEGVPDIALQKRRLSLLVSALRAIFGIVGAIMILYGTLVLRYSYYLYDVQSGLILLTIGLVLTAIAVKLKPKKLLLPPYFGRYRLMYTGSIEPPIITESTETQGLVAALPGVTRKTAVYESPQDMVLYVAHSFEPSEEALAHPEVAERTRFFDYITERIRTQLNARPQETPPATKLHEETTLAIQAFVKKYVEPNDKRADVVSEVVQRWPLHEGRYTQRASFHNPSDEGTFN